ncbi:MAG: hypothetical protein P8J45_13150 [Phycisphaerales bacterium]|nr:hypothetical protein [Phycisphaerales bacterium]
MIYRYLCRFNDLFGLLVFGVYLAAFMLAFVMVFLFPPGALLLVMLGLAGFVLVWVVMMITRGLERSMARTRIQKGLCPTCEGDLVTSPAPEPTSLGDPETILTCARCSMNFEENGTRFNPLSVEDEEADNLLEGPAV